MLLSWEEVQWQKWPWATRRYSYSANDPGLSRSSNSGWNDVAERTRTMTSLSHLNKSANRHTKRPNRMHRKFPFVHSSGCALPSLMEFRSFRPISSTDEETEGSAYAPPPVPFRPSGGNVNEVSTRYVYWRGCEVRGRRKEVASIRRSIIALEN
jgi:hypothetical protein